ncbi:CLUMA_CG008067, isoform A [Clunio marinus]|uniref:CLUMA_CG008067, isoform A n=1 Tax=Clunio marinus TaxID=568069 RepID=A0A1J1I6J9_9DIPT|nr:CLUMA_CG008067, isoform A [Clunio marinus]
MSKNYHCCKAKDFRSHMHILSPTDCSLSEIVSTSRLIIPPCIIQKPEIYRRRVSTAFPVSPKNSLSHYSP